jgi:hypothetical protein
LTETNTYSDSILATSAFITCASAVVITPRADSNDATSDSPFHDCLDSGKNWSDCRLAVNAHFDLKRDTTNSSRPFHDCLDNGGSWADCRLAVQANTVDSRSEVKERSIIPKILGTIIEIGQTLGQSEKCYSVNSLGSTDWLTNTAVNGLSNQACTFAVNQAISQLATYAPALGTYTETGLQGYYQANGGPVVTDSVKFFLSTIFEGNFTDLPSNVDLHQFGIDLCNKGVSHLTGDPGCTAARKSAGKTEHISVNGGEFNYASDGANAIFNNAGICINCLFSMVLEASNMVDKDGSTATPIDS